MLTIWFSECPSIAQRLLRSALTPLAALTAVVARRQLHRVIRRAIDRRPAVVVIGNLLAGGTGKTPAVIAIASEMQRRGWRVGVLTRGYRARSTQARLVRPDSQASHEGDEPVLIAVETGLPVAAATRRAEALALLEQAQPELDLVISDDGLQHAALPRTLEIAVFDARGVGNHRLLPAGPLREPLERVDAVDAFLLNAIDLLPPAVAGHCSRGQPAFGFEVRPDGFRQVSAQGSSTPGMTLGRFAQHVAGRTIAAVAGIARPERFFASLSALGLTFREYPLADHASIDAGWLAGLPEAVVVMTAKDAVKCQAFADARCWMLDVRAHIDPDFFAWLEERLHGPSTS